MKKTLPISDEMINAFIDNELEAEDYGHILELTITNQALSDAINQARKLKALVKSARQTPPVSIKNVTFAKTQNYKMIYMTASLVLALMAVLVSISPDKNLPIANAGQSVFIKNSSPAISTATQQNINLVLHLKSAEKKQARKLFDVLETILKTSTSSHNNLQIEVVLTGPGLYLLLQDTSTYRNAIHIIGEKYRNITFIACGKTLKKLQLKSSEDIKIIKDAMLVFSGPAWIKKRKQQGWSYFYI